nr:MAG TPA: hypothetical protein [Caudoviricetes sp.]DAT40507.1 MAG TPA: hypothetical protein [Caudoviricetes sp.]
MKDLNIKDLRTGGIVANYISAIEYFKRLNIDIMNIHSLLKDILKKIKK